MKILIDVMIVMLVYMVGYKMGINYANDIWRDKLEEIIQEELERRKDVNNTREDKTEA